MARVDNKIKYFSLREVGQLFARLPVFVVIMKRSLPPAFVLITGGSVTIQALSI
jgi:hypothetical protein